MARELDQNLLEKWARENPKLEILLWLEKCKDNSGKITSFKCKACTMFEKGIDRMHNCKRTWIKGYSGED